ncbi:MAG: hypothetical protein OHK0023_11290 [Anaerolineae bacterium]
MPEVTTPSNIEYMILGYGLAALIMGALVGYMMLKARRLRQEAKMLAELETDNDN